MNQLITIMLTVVSGVLVYVIGQIILECYIKPLQEYHKIKSEISFLLVFYANVFLNPINLSKKNHLSQWEDKSYSEASIKLREVAAKLEGFKQQKPFFVRKDKIEKVKGALISLSNGMYSPNTDEQVKHNEQSEENIRKGLHLR